MVNPAMEKQQGLLKSLTTLAATFVAMMHTRLELLSTDLEEDREHLLALLCLVMAAMFCLGVGMLLATLLVVAMFWETHRLVALASMAGLFLVVGAATCALAIHKTKSKPRIFTSSLLELFKDRQQLDANRPDTDD
jgi:uncharacterized membrane protein YqjE